MSLPHDVRQAFRLIRKVPWFTAASVTVIGLGIGATTAIFARSAPIPWPHFAASSRRVRLQSRT